MDFRPLITACLGLAIIVLSFFLSAWLRRVPSPGKGSSSRRIKFSARGARMAGNEALPLPPLPPAPPILHSPEGLAPETGILETRMPESDSLLQSDLRKLDTVLKEMGSRESRAERSPRREGVQAAGIELLEASDPFERIARMEEG